MQCSCRCLEECSFGWLHVVPALTPSSAYVSNVLEELIHEGNEGPERFVVPFLGAVLRLHRAIPSRLRGILGTLSSRKVRYSVNRRVTGK